MEYICPVKYALFTWEVAFPRFRFNLGEKQVGWYSRLEAGMEEWRAGVVLWNMQLARTNRNTPADLQEYARF